MAVQQDSRTSLNHCFATVACASSRCRARSAEHLHGIEQRATLARVLDEDEEAGVGAVETAEKLFAELSERLSQRKRPAGAPEAVLQFKVADAAWVIDLRRGASELVRRGTVPAPDVTVTVPNEQDLLELLRRRLSPFRALATKRLQFRGDLKVLRSLEWVWRSPSSGSRIHDCVMLVEILKR